MTESLGSEAESLAEALARIEARQRSANPERFRAELRRSMDLLAAKLGVDGGTDPTALAEGEPEADPVDGIDSDSASDATEVAYWAAWIHHLPLMPNSRHATCALEIEAGVIAEGVLNGEWNLSVTATEGELRDLVRRGVESLNEMLIGNLRLALTWANRAARGDADLAQDYFQEAYFGLFRAIEGWDALRGYAFSTYATWHLRQTIARSMHGGAQRTPVHIPVHVGEQESAARKTGEESRLTRLAGEWRRAISWERLCEEVPDLQSILQPSPIDDLLDRLDVITPTVFSLSLLDPREAEVIAARFGIGGGEPETLDEIGQRLGITRERVRQIERKALQKARLRLAASSGIRPGVIEYVRASCPELEDLVSRALDWQCSTRSEISSALRVPAPTAVTVLEAIESALPHSTSGVTGYPVGWQTKSSEWKSLLAPYEPPLSPR